MFTAAEWYNESCIIQLHKCINTFQIYLALIIAFSVPISNIRQLDAPIKYKHMLWMLTALEVHASLRHFC